VFGNRLHHGRCPGRALLNHGVGGFHRYHLQVGRLIGACAGAHIEYRTGGAQRRPNGLGNPGIWLAGDDITLADLVIDCLHSRFPIPFTPVRSRREKEPACRVCLSSEGVTHAE